MSDPLRTDSARTPLVPGDADREARIEQLLLSGLDHYFAGEYEQAINVWTRVVFLERGHDRARAYIERARGALAERHRESEELLHRGVAAFNRGETEAARDLITRAVEQGGNHDLALVFLERLNRLGTGVPLKPAGEPSVVTPHHPETPEPVRRRRRPWIAVAIVVAALFSAAALGTQLGWLSGFTVAPPAEQVHAVEPDPVPVPRSSEMVLARARSLYAGGHLRDALRLLDAVTIADPMRPEADRLRADVQRQLLAAGRAARAEGPAAPGARP